MKILRVEFSVLSLAILFASVATFCFITVPTATAQVVLTSTALDSNTGYIHDGDHAVNPVESADGIGNWATAAEGATNVFRMQILRLPGAGGDSTITPIIRVAAVSFTLPDVPAGHTFSSAALTVFESGGNPHNYDIGIYHSLPTAVGGSFFDFTSDYDVPTIKSGASTFDRVSTLFSTNNGIDDGTGFFDGRFYTDNDISSAIAAEYAAPTFDGNAHFMFLWELPAENPGVGNPIVPGELIDGVAASVSNGERSVFFVGGAPEIDITFDPVSGPLADFDNDTDVDGADFLLWQTNPGVGSLTDWQSEYGNFGLTSSVTAVPEPGSLVLLLAGLPAMVRRRRSR